MSFSYIAWVGLGGGLGSLMRWQLGQAFKEKYRGLFPASTFIINITGAFALGLLSTYFSINWQGSYSSFLNAGIYTGLIGGYTTFSSMQLEALKLVTKSERSLALFYLFLSIVAGLLSAWAGISIANTLV